MAFQLDTNGEVPTDYNPLTKYRWDDISPFTQGYIEALFASLTKPVRGALCPTMRVKRLGISTLNIATGAHGAERIEWRAEPCASPLFGADKDAGKCKSCADGWAVEANHPLAFSDLAPETLARIIADCEAANTGVGEAANGAAFWRVRNKPLLPEGDWSVGFPPLTVQLGDDGKVRFA